MAPAPRWIRSYSHPPWLSLGAVDQAFCRYNLTIAISIRLLYNYIYTYIYIYLHLFKNLKWYRISESSQRSLSCLVTQSCRSLQQQQRSCFGFHLQAFAKHNALTTPLYLPVGATYSIYLPTIYKSTKCR